MIPFLYIGVFFFFTVILKKIFKVEFKKSENQKSKDLKIIENKIKELEIEISKTSA